MAKNKSDYKKPRINLNDYLPAYLQTETNLSLNETLFNRFLTKNEFDKIVGLIGIPDPNDKVIKNITETDEYNQKNQLQPVAHAKIGTEDYFLSFKDFLTRLQTLGVDIERFNEWGNALQFNWVPPIDFDKLINYQDYYWKSNAFDSPDYIVIKNIQTWANARLIQAKKSIFSSRPQIDILEVNTLTNVIVLPSNVSNEYEVGEYLILTDGANYDLFEVLVISYNPLTSNTEILLNTYNRPLSSIHNRFVKTRVPVDLINLSDSTFSINGDMTSIFVNNYIFSSILLSGQRYLSTKSSVFENGKTVIQTNESLQTADFSNIDISLYIFMLEGEYSKIVDSNIIKNPISTWKISDIASLKWTDEFIVKPISYNGNIEFNSNIFMDSTANFISSGVVPSDFVKIKTNPNKGKFTISNVYSDNLILYTDHKFFDTFCQYEIVRNFNEEELKSTIAPQFPNINKLWIDTISDILKQWNGIEWINLIQNYSLINKITKNREHIDFNKTINDWSVNNKWIHKDQITEYSNVTRAQLPIIEYSPYVELSNSSYAKKTWKYRTNNQQSFIDSNIPPTLFELQKISIDDSTELSFQFDTLNSIILHNKYGNLTNELTNGVKIKLSGFSLNNGIYEVEKSEFIQFLPNQRYFTKIFLKESIIDPFDLPVQSTVSPVYTSNGDIWLGAYDHWMINNIEIIPSSIIPERNPMLDVYIGSFIDVPNDLQSHYGLYWQSFNKINNSSYNLELTFHESLHDLVLYDDYQEGDIRIYINNIRQYGNYSDKQSLINPLYVGGIQFSNMVISPNDVIRIELGEYAKDDIGKRSVIMPVYRKSTETGRFVATGGFNRYNLVDYRNIAQVKLDKNTYPYFRMFDVSGKPKPFSTNIFKYGESEDSPINIILGKRIIFDSIRKDYSFRQELTDPISKELFCYNDISVDNGLQTIWKVGSNNEQYVPTKIGDSWDIAEQLYYNTHHENYNDIKLTQIYNHFNSIINSQTLEGIIVSNGSSYYLDDDINYGLGGTIKEFNDGFDLLFSSIFTNNVNPINLITFAQEQYLFQLRYLQDIFSNNIMKLLTDNFNNLLELSNNINEFVLDSFESNEKFDQWFGDSTTYNQINYKGVRNWIATIPYLNMSKPVKPYYVFDDVLKIYEMIHHDGHRHNYGLSIALKEYLNKYVLNNSNSETQIISDESQPFPLLINGQPLTNGDVVLRYNTVNKTRILYRFNTSNIWEKIDFDLLLINSILNIENKLYERVIELENDPVFDLSIIKSDLAYNKIIKQQFSQYLKSNNIDNPYLLTNIFDQNNPFTWNYFYTPIPEHPVTGLSSDNTAGCWQALYQKVYNTPYPHLEPWKLQGYDNKPDWWDNEYKANNRRWNSSMWNNILNGVIPVGKITPDGNIGTGSSYQIPYVYGFVSVNIDSQPTSDGILPDGLLPPYWSSINTNNVRVRSLYDPNKNQFIILPNTNFEFGQLGFHEWEWTISTERGYDDLVAAFKLQPMRFINQLFGTEFLTINCLQIDKHNKKVFSHKDTIFHGDYNDNQIFYSNGINQWYVHYNRYMGFDGISSEFRTLWKDWDNPLSYLFNSFIDVKDFSIYNKYFDITDKDYNISIKNTKNVNNKWLDSLKATVLTVPSKYSKLRDRGIGWTVQFNSSSPISKEIELYGSQNYNFKMIEGNNVFRTYSYDIKNISITEPYGFQIVNYNQKINLSSNTNFSNSNFTYFANIIVDDIHSINIEIPGYMAQTFSQLVNELNKQLGEFAYATIQLGNLVIASNKIGVNSSILITDNGLFSTANNNFINIYQPQQTDYGFNKYFILNGNLTSIFDQQEKIIVTDSTNYDGIYTIKSIEYDYNNLQTKIYVNENVNIDNSIIDGIIEPFDALTLPLEWQNGTEVFLNTTGYLPYNLDDQTPYYFVRLNDREFHLTQYPEQINSYNVITPMSSPEGEVFVGRVNSTFKAMAGERTDYIWRKHVVDKRQILSYPQPLILSGIQSIVDFITGYESYLLDLGFVCKSPNAENNDLETGRINNWQLVLEKFISWLNVLRTVNQDDHLTYKIKFDNVTSSITLLDATTNWENGSKVLLSAGINSALPEPFNNPYTQFVPYFIVRNYDTNNQFKLALTKLDALKGRFVEFIGDGYGDLYIENVKTEIVLPKYELNPFKKYIWIEHEQGIISNIFSKHNSNIINDQTIYNAQGNSLTNHDVLILRQDKETRISLNTDLINRIDNNILRNNPYISGLHVFIDSYENIIWFNDYSVTNSLIYDSFLGLNTPRFYVEFNRQHNNSLRPNVGGYVLSDNKLIQNFESLTDDMRYYYDSYKLSETKKTVREVRKSLGYDGSKDYLDDIRLNSKTQFIFWKGMIQNKGTNFAIDAFTNQRLFNGANVDEFWAYKVAEFGDNKEKNYIEMKLYPSDSVRKEFRAEFTTPDEDVLDHTFENIKLTDQSRWWNQPDQMESMPEHVSFYFNADIVKRYRLRTDDPNDPWDLNIINPSANEWYVELPEIAEGVILTYFDTESNTTKQLNNLIDYVFLNNKVIKIIKNSNVISGNGLTTTFNPFKLKLIVSVFRYNYDAQNPARLIDKKSKTVITNVPIWNPAYGHYNQNAYSIIDIKSPNDPALYNNQITGNITDAPWTDNKVGTVWFDNRNEGYIPYYDPQLVPKINDRIYLWGKTSDWNEVHLYEWTESLVHPDDWDELVESEKTNNEIAISDKKTGTPYRIAYKKNGLQANGQPRWEAQVDSHYEKTAALITSNTNNPFTGIVEIYINGKFDSTVNLDSTVFFKYINIRKDSSTPLNRRIYNKDIIRVIKRAPKISSLKQSNTTDIVIGTPYTMITKFDKITNSVYNVYYFWVNKKTKKNNDKVLSLFEAEKQIQIMPDPYMILQGLRTSDFGYGLIYGNIFDENSYNLPLRYSQLIVKGMRGIVKDENRYVLRFTRDFTLRDSMIMGSNNVYKPLYLKNKHVEWKLFRKNQFQKIDRYLWDKIIESCIEHRLTNDAEIDYSKTIPSLNRILYDDLYNGQTRFGFGDEQIFVDKNIAIKTIINVLSDPNIDYGYIDIDQFLTSNKFDTIENIFASLNEIYNNFSIKDVNNIFFEVLHDAMTMKYESSDLFKTSWVALEIAQNVSISQNDQLELINLENNGICGFITQPTPTPIYSPTPTPTPFPTPTPTVTPSATVTITPTITPSMSMSATITPTITPSNTVTPTVTRTPEMTPTPQPTPSITPSLSPTTSLTPTVTITMTSTPIETVTPTITPTPTVTESVTPTPTLTTTPSVTETVTPTPTITPTVTPTLE